MASSELVQAFDCAICMDRLDVPKLLKCHHSFCENCLDKLIVFKGDGSGTIICPFCNSVTGIDADKTANDLPSNYQLQTVLDIINTKTDPNKKTTDKCSHSVDCTNESSYFCSTCSTILCLSCKEAHNSRVHYKSSTTHYYPLKYDPYEDKTKVVCSKHNALGDYFCCNDIICVYCKHREHASHNVETTSLKADNIKDVMSPYDPIEQNRLKMEKKIESVEEMLKNVIFSRKLKCLIDHIVVLNNEEKRLLSEYHKITQNQLSNLPRCTSVHNKYDFEIVLNQFHHKPYKPEYATKSVGQVTFGLKESKVSTPLNHLGNLCITRGSYYSVKSEQVRSCVQFDNSISEAGESDSSLLLKEFKNLVRNVLPYEPMDDGTEYSTSSKMERKVLPSAPILENEPSATSEREPQYEVLVLENATSVAPTRETQEVLPSAPIMENEPSATSEREPQEDVLPSASIIIMGDEPSATPEREPHDEDINWMEMVDPEVLENALQKMNTEGLKYIKNLCLEKEETLMICLLEQDPYVLMTMKERFNYDNTLLHYAASHGCDKVLKYIRLNLNYTSFVDQVERLNGGTPLHFAVLGNHVACVKELLRMNADVALKNRGRLTPLAEARMRKKTKNEIITLLQQGL